MSLTGLEFQNTTISKLLGVLLTSRRSVSAVLNQYLSAIVGLNSKSEALAEISLMLIGFEICGDDPAMIYLYIEWESLERGTIDRQTIEWGDC